MVFLQLESCLLDEAESPKGAAVTLGKRRDPPVTESFKHGTRLPESSLLPRASSWMLLYIWVMPEDCGSRQRLLRWVGLESQLWVPLGTFQLCDPQLCLCITGIILSLPGFFGGWDRCGESPACPRNTINVGIIGHQNRSQETNGASLPCPPLTGTSEIILIVLFPLLFLLAAILVCKYTCCGESEQWPSLLGEAGGENIRTTRTPQGSFLLLSFCPQGQLLKR